jgi:hypothetical protein
MGNVRTAIPALASLESFEALAPALTNSMCVYLSGSLAAGFGHASSDLDINVVSKELPRGFDAAGSVQLSVDPPSVPIVCGHVGGTPCDAELWLEDQAMQLLAKLPAGSTPAESLERADLTDGDIDSLYRLSIGRPISGAGWLEHAQARLTASGFDALLARQHAGVTEALVGDALGMLESGDAQSASLAARAAFGSAVDGLLVQHGELSPGAKWRVRKMLRADPQELPFQEYWDIETMAGFNAAMANEWVLGTVECSRRLVGCVDAYFASRHEGGYSRDDR